MRQHPIPQNVLDVEFKLFTRLTLKEFAYLAAGIVSGSLFLILNRQFGLPGLIAWPAFIALSAIGAFFALVPINDQGADTFVKNFFTAINKPTQRVWLNDQMQEQRIKPVVQTDNNKKKVIGGSNQKTPKAFEEKPGDDILEITTAQKNVTATTIQPVQETPVVRNSITVSTQNISSYQFPIQTVDRLPGNINIWLADMNNRGLPNIPVYLKDQNQKVIYANRTGPNGYFLSNQMLQPGIYFIQFDSSNYKIPNIQWVLDQGQSKNPIKITATLK